MKGGRRRGAVYTCCIYIIGEIFEREVAKEGDGPQLVGDLICHGTGGHVACLALIASSHFALFL